MDALAADGARFEWAFNAQSICVPSRTAMLGGVFPSSAGVTDNFAMPADIPTLAHAFGDQGYRTAYLGKWHLDDEPADQFYIPTGWRRRGFNDLWAVNQTNHRYNRAHLFYDSATIVRPVPEDTYQPQWYTDLALDYLDQHVASGTTAPFFMMLAYGGPHPPPGWADWGPMIPQPYLDAVDPSAITFRDNVPQWVKGPVPQLTAPPHCNFN